MTTASWASHEMYLVVLIMESMGSILLLFFLKVSIITKKWISGSDLGQHLPQNFSSRSWTRSGEISCRPHTSLDEINNSVVRSERGALVRVSNPPLVYSADTTAGEVWHALTRLLLKTHLAAGVSKAETTTLDRLIANRKKIVF